MATRLGTSATLRLALSRLGVNQLQASDSTNQIHEIRRQDQVSKCVTMRQAATSPVSPMRGARHPKRQQVLVFALVCCCLWLASLFLIQMTQREPNLHADEKINQPEEVNKSNLFGQVEFASVGPTKRRNGIKYFKPKFKLSNQVIDHLSETKYRHLFSVDQSKNNHLLGHENVTVSLEPDDSYRNVVECGDSIGGIKLLVVVNSNWKNWKRRRRLRSSWLNLEALRRNVCLSHGGKLAAVAQVEFVFALGQPAAAAAVAASQNPNRGLGAEDLRTQRPSRSTTPTPSDSNAPPFEASVAREAQEFGDLLVMNVRDHYRGLSLKHLSIFKWLLGRRTKETKEEEQQQQQRKRRINGRLSGSSAARTLSEQSEASHDRRVEVLLKCDDDAEVNLNQLLTLYGRRVARRRNQVQWPEVRETLSGEQSSVVDRSLVSRVRGLRADFFGTHSDSADSLSESMDDDDDSSLAATESNSWQKQVATNWLMCARFLDHTPVLRQPNRKWRLTPQEFPYDTFPAYCSGLAYLAPIELVARWLVLAHETLRRENNGNHGDRQSYERPLWVDDVFVTGILTASMEQQPEIIKLNARFCYTVAQQSLMRRLNTTCLVTEMIST